MIYRIINTFNPWKEWRAKEEELKRSFQIIENLRKEHLDHQHKINNKYGQELNKFKKIKDFQEDQNKKIDSFKKVILLLLLIL